MYKLVHIAGENVEYGKSLLESKDLRLCKIKPHKMWDWRNMAMTPWLWFDHRKINSSKSSSLKSQEPYTSLVCSYCMQDIQYM